MSQGENVLPNFNNSYRETAISEDNIDDDDADDDDDDVAENEGGVNSSSRRFWSHAEDEVLVKAWLEVVVISKLTPNKRGLNFGGKIEKMFDNVRLYKEKLYNEGAEGATKSELLKVRNLEQLRSRWKRIAASCAKFSGAYASAVERRASGECDNDEMKLAHKIYRAVENIVDTCKKNTSNQGNNSKRSHVNEAGKNKVMNVPSESFQQWLDVVKNMNITRQSETEMEREKLKYERERESTNSSNSSSTSSNNSDNSNQQSINDYNRRCERRRQANRVVDRMMDEFMVANNPFEFFQTDNQVPRAPRVLVQRNHDDRNDRLWNDYFADQPQHPDATGRLGASSLLKCTAAMRLLVYGTADDSVEDYLRINASLARDSLQHFVEGILCNDINVLDRSPLFTDVFEGRAPPINYVVNGRQYNMGYYLIDGIYPKWAAFIPMITLPKNEKEGLFSKLQESRRKDVERAFGILQARFAIIRQPALAHNT
ncbi:uncharacterized protein [Spinacia oleracea]|uniref:Myb/SANT-like domain-containing protein n=1 Tax=Spinacia oleracea TaxID=3562 RepID=A0ABM3RHS3_SPIOL|nr:uncharacterized protein LOC130469730 [Spinacia oleracea]